MYECVCVGWGWQTLWMLIAVGCWLALLKYMGSFLWNRIEQWKCKRDLYSFVRIYIVNGSMCVWAFCIIFSTFSPISFEKNTIYYTAMTIVFDILLAKCQRAKCMLFDTGSNKRHKKDKYDQTKQPSNIHTSIICCIHSHKIDFCFNASHFPFWQRRVHSKINSHWKRDRFYFLYLSTVRLFVRHIDVTFLLAVSIAVLRLTFKIEIERNWFAFHFNASHIKHISNI